MGNRTSPVVNHNFSYPVFLVVEKTSKLKWPKSCVSDCKGIVMGVFVLADILAGRYNWSKVSKDKTLWKVKCFSVRYQWLRRCQQKHEAHQNNFVLSFMGASVLKAEKLSMVHMTKKWARNYISKMDVCWKSLKEVYLGVYDTSVICVIEVS